MIDPSTLSQPERLLWAHGVRSPEHIDLEAIAASRGARVIYRQLDGCAARLVASGGNAIISVAFDDNPGRRRFSLGHELAHWVCDANKTSFKCANIDIGPQNAEAKSAEANANNYASQFLLPDYLVVPWVGPRPANLDLAQALANDFRASLTASAIKLVKRAKAPSVVACHDQTRLRWFLRNLAFPHEFFVLGQLHQDTVAFDMAFGAASGMSRPKREPANHWLNGPGTYKREVSSQSVKLPDATVLSLISFV